MKAASAISSRDAEFHSFTLPPVRRFLPLILVALVAAILIFFIARPKPVAVQFVIATAADIQTSVVASGRVLPPARVDIGATITGRVETVRVREGARVAADEVLVELEQRELKAAVAQAQAALQRAQARVSSVQTLALPTAVAAQQQAQANLALAEREAQRARELVAKGFVSQSRVEDAERQLEVARSALASARAQSGAQSSGGAEAQQAQSQRVEAEAVLQLAQAKLAQALIRAPAAGVVLERMIEPGDIAQPGRRMMTLALDGAARLIVQVDEKNLPLIKAGAVATAAADAFPDERFEAIVNYISPGIDAARGTVELRLDVPKPPALLKSDMTVAIDVPGPLLKNTIMLPADAIRQLQTDTPWVLVEREGTAVRVPVKTGLQTQGRVVITEGVQAGERVILSRDLEAGARVRGRE
ncbi:MAG: efflux RND transporter periplasmic adaptor subunit [Burkholderiales bacterium]|nr:efflux RND transporter periplasmic adaptor subunit [Burkholderiales bacterium]